MNKTNNIMTLLPTLHNQRQVIVIGAAVIDVIADAYSLPYRGSDIELHQQSVNVGGCALNVAITIQRLGLTSVNALPLGQGVWADIIRLDLKKKRIQSIINHAEGDNGWCLALVEPDGERTFLSVSGVENQWDKKQLQQIHVERNAIIYLSGYQLASQAKYTLVEWLESLDNDVELFIDFGPRIADIEPPVFERLLAMNTTVTLNRQEAEYIQSDILMLVDQTSLNVERLAETWRSKYQNPIIVRLDQDGAFYSMSSTISGDVPIFKTEIIDTIGAGDSHAGGVLSGLASGWSLKEAVTLGNAVASYVVNQRGGDSAPLRNELSKYLSKY